MLDDYRLRLTAESSEVDRSSAIAADEGRPVDCLVGHVAGRPMYAHDILDPMRDELRRRKEEVAAELVVGARQPAHARLDARTCFVEPHGMSSL